MKIIKEIKPEDPRLEMQQDEHKQLVEASVEFMVEEIFRNWQNKYNLTEGHCMDIGMSIAHSMALSVIFTTAHRYAKSLPENIREEKTREMVEDIFKLLIKRIERDMERTLNDIQELTVCNGECEN